MLKTIKKNNEYKSVELDVETNLIKDEVENSSDVDVYADDDYDSEED